jgi:outer membrane protein assembly factor BamB
MKKVQIASLVLLLVAGAAMAQRGGHEGNRGGGGPEGGGLIVGSNGTVFVTSVVRDSATDTSSMRIVAITSAGSQAWTATLANRGHLTLSGNVLLSVSDSSTGTAVSSTITAINTTTGATAWTLNQAGRVLDLEPFSGGTYATVVTPAAAAGAAATRSLVAISSSGTVLWSVSL